MRKHYLLYMLLCVIFLTGLVGCTQQSQQSQASNEGMAQAVADGFKLSDLSGSALSAEDQDLWQQLTDDELSALTPVTVLAEHTSGIRLYLCRDTSRTGLDGWMIASINSDGSGKGTLRKLDTFDIWIKTYGIYDTPVVPENKGWMIRIPADETALFNKDMYGLFQIAARNSRDEVTYVPVILLAQQLVAGTNYKYLCTDKEGTHLYILDIYEDMNSGADINATGYVDLDIYSSN